MSEASATGHPFVHPTGDDLVREWTDDDGTVRPVVVLRLPPGYRAISSAVVGGGIAPCGWWVNAQVSKNYDRPDPVAHAAAVAAGFGLTGGGVAMLTAADVRHVAHGADGGVAVVATVGLGLPVPAAAPPSTIAVETYEPAYRPGTINVLVSVPVALSDAALVNAVITATEAKTQALVEAGVPGTGTSSDALCIACPVQPLPGNGFEPYGGPRSRWGERVARAVHAAVAEGTDGWLRRHPPGDPHRRWPA